MELCLLRVGRQSVEWWGSITTYMPQKYIEYIHKPDALFSCLFSDIWDPGSISGLGRSAGEGIGYLLQCSWASLVAQLVRICLQWGRPGFDPGVGMIPWRRERLPTPVFWPREFHGLYSPWGHKESDMAEQLSLSRETSWLSWIYHWNESIV